MTVKKQTITGDIKESDVILPEDLYIIEQSGQISEDEKGLIDGYKKGYVAGYKYGFNSAIKKEPVPSSILPSPQQKNIIQTQPTQPIEIAKTGGIPKSILYGGIFAIIVAGLIIMRKKKSSLSNLGMSRDEIISNYITKLRAYQKQLDYYKLKGISKQDIIYTKLLNDINKLKVRLRAMNVEPNNIGIK